jgi:hypothetical protein
MCRSRCLSGLVCLGFWGVGFGWSFLFFSFGGGGGRRRERVRGHAQTHARAQGELVARLLPPRLPLVLPVCVNQASCLLCWFVGFAKRRRARGLVWMVGCALPLLWCPPPARLARRQPGVAIRQQKVARCHSRDAQLGPTQAIIARNLPCALSSSSIIPTFLQSPTLPVFRALAFLFPSLSSSPPPFLCSSPSRARPPPPPNSSRAQPTESGAVTLIRTTHSPTLS